jgi:hypothetical protein
VHGVSGCLGVEIGQSRRKGKKLRVVTIRGSSMSEEQERQILKTVGEDGQVELRFHYEEAGKTWAKVALSKLGEKVSVKTLWRKG